MNIITIDFETFYSQQFSLSKITTEEYVRHELFETIGVAVKVNDGETQWFSGPKAATKKWLDQFPWDDAVAIAHNAVFDMAILNWQFDIRPKRIADTLSMARALHGTDGISLSLKSLAEYFNLGVKGTEVINALGKRRLDFTAEEMARYGDYCINDVELTYELFKLLADGFPMSELRLIDLTIRMFTEPKLTLDKGVLENHLLDVQAKKEALMSKLNYDKADLMSNPKLAELLEFHGVVVPMKVSPANGKQTFAFAKSDEAFKELLEHENIQVQAIVAARLGVKSTLEETRTERFINIADRGTLPIPLRYYAAHTGRWGGDDKVNMQNLPRKSPLKKAIRAPDGYLLVDCDSSQIEARTLAWLAEQDDLVADFDKGEDVYKRMATAIYNVAFDNVTDAQRFVGKTTILGAGYGMGAAKFKAQLKTFGVDMELGECEYIIKVYRDTYPMIPRLWKQAGRALNALMAGQTAPFGRDGVLVVDTDGIKLPNGLYIKYPRLRTQAQGDRQEMVYDTKKGRATIPTRIYGGKAVENVCQALARIVIGEQMLMVARKLPVVMTVHDAVGALVKIDDADVGRTFVEQCMRIRPKWALGLPLNCESKIGASYGG
jgi:DNA polymerase I-like protein with 3'-5' exonuclease and polymerase domains